MNEPAKLVVNDQRSKRDEVVPVNKLPANPLEMLAVAQSRGASIEELRQFMDLQERWEKNEARKAYVAAIAEFKKNPPKVVKDLWNPQFKSMYASLGNFTNEVNPALAVCGLTANWKLHQAEKIKVTCVLTHVQGHSETCELESGPDTTGSKNGLHAIKSTITYLELATFQAITGIVATNGAGDDDGNGAGAPQKDKEPEGYNDWALDMEALADEGLVRLQEAWKRAPESFKRYTVKFEPTWWANMKSKAKKVQP